MLANFNENLEKYARLIVETGVSVKRIIPLSYKSTLIGRLL